MEHTIEGFMREIPGLQIGSPKASVMNWLTSVPDKVDGEAISSLVTSSDLSLCTIALAMLWTQLLTLAMF